MSGTFTSLKGSFGLRKIWEKWRTDELFERIKRRSELFSESLSKLESAKTSNALLESTSDVCDRLSSAVAIYKHLEVIVESLAESARADTRYDCAATIKIISKSEFHGCVPSISTLIRDTLSAAKRSAESLIPISFPYIKNTAFATLIDQPHSQDYFVSADLEALEKEGHYNNSNPVWMKFYNKTAVVPIRRSVYDRTGTIIGFLCIDSLNGDVRQRKIIDKLVFVSEHIYTVFGFLYALYGGRADQLGWVCRNQEAPRPAQEIHPKIEIVLGHLRQLSRNPQEQTRENAPVTSGHPSITAGLTSVPRIGETMQMQYCDRGSDVSSITADLQTAFEQIVSETPILAGKFLDAFAQRSKIPELAESQGLFEGLRQVLSYLLPLYPDKEAFIGYRGILTSEHEKPADRDLIQLKKAAHSAIGELEMTYPSILIQFQENVRRQATSAEETLGALMALYIQNRDGYPF